jgi:hypothetical protein
VTAIMSNGHPPLAFLVFLTPPSNKYCHFFAYLHRNARNNTLTSPRSCHSQRAHLSESGGLRWNQLIDHEIPSLCILYYSPLHAAKSSQTLCLTFYSPTMHLNSYCDYCHDYISVATTPRTSVQQGDTPGLVRLGFSVVFV